MSLGAFVSRLRDMGMISANTAGSRMEGSPAGEQDRIRAHSELHENMRSEYKNDRKTAHPKAGRSSY